MIIIIFFHNYCYHYLVFVCFQLKLSSRVKNHHFSEFAIFRWLNRAYQELSFKNNPEKKCFFFADLWSANVFSMLIILIDLWQVLSYSIRVLLLNQANHPVWQKSLFTSIVLTVFLWSLKVNASKEEKRACPFSSSNPRRKKTTKSFCRQRVGFEISREWQGLLQYSRKQGHPTVIFGKTSVRKTIWDLEFSEHLL